MENSATQQEQSPLLNITDKTEGILLSTGKWSRFLGVFMLLIAGLYLLSLVVDLFTTLDRLNNSFLALPGQANYTLTDVIARRVPQLSVGAIVLAIYIYMFLLYNKFSTRIKLAMNNKEQRKLVAAVKSMNALFLVQAILICTSVVIMFFVMVIR